MNRVCERNCAATKGNRLPQRESQTAGVADSTRERANCVWKNLSGGSATIKLHQTPASRSESGHRRGGRKKDFTSARGHFINAAHEYGTPLYFTCRAGRGCAGEFAAKPGDSR